MSISSCFSDRISLRNLLQDCLNTFLPDDLIFIILDYTQNLGQQLWDLMRLGLEEREEEDMNKMITDYGQRYSCLEQRVKEWIQKNRRSMQREALNGLTRLLYSSVNVFLELGLSLNKNEPKNEEWKACRYFFLKQGLRVFCPLFHNEAFHRQSNTPKYECENVCFHSNLFVIQLLSPTNHEQQYRLIHEGVPESVPVLNYPQPFDFSNIPSHYAKRVCDVKTNEVLSDKEE